VCEIHNHNQQLSEVDTVAQVVRMVVERMKNRIEEDMYSVFIKAAEEERNGEDCLMIYKECEGEDFEKKLLQ
jgi:hypothetical protein